MLNVQTLKSYLKITGNDQDIFLDSCLNQAVSLVENYCNRKLTSGSFTQYSDGINSTELFLDNYPINSVTTIEWFDGFDEWQSIFNSPDSTANSVLILPTINKIKLIKGYFFPSGCNNIRTVYTAGWASGMASDDVKSVLLEISATLYRNSAESGDAILGKSSVNLNSNVSESASFIDLTPQWINKLKKYRLVNY